jgi:TPR repeat protein
MLRRLIMRSSHHFGSVFRLTPLRAHSISCMLTIICAVLLHQGNIIRKRSLGVDIVRLPPTKVATNQTHGVGRALNLSVRLGSLPSAGNKGWLGVKIQSLELPLALSLGRANADGAIIIETTPGGPAALAGILPGDIVVRYNGNVVGNSSDFRQRVLATAPHRELPLVLWRAAAEGSDFVRLLRGLADGGNSYVMYHLGNMYEYGNGVGRDAAQALHWYRRGADAANPSAMTAMAVVLIEGRLTSKDQQAGLRLLRLAAEKDNPEAMRQLASRLVAGDIISQDFAEAERLLSKAAGVGHAPSMVDLGILYDNRKTEEGWHKAAMWYVRAIDRGNTAAMIKLGFLFELGNGVPQNPESAAALYERAANDRYASGMYAWARMLDDGKGVSQRDPETAATLILQALDLGDEIAYREMTQNSRAWTPEFRRALQNRLQVTGFYAGRVDGELGTGTIAALNAYLQRSH